MDNAVILCLALIITLLSGFYIYGVSKKPKDEQFEDLEYWLRKLIWEAEGYFGSKTGQIKLAYVYNLAVSKFPWIAAVMTFEEFNEKYIQGGLEWLEKQLRENPKARDLMRSLMLSNGLNVAEFDNKYNNE